MNPCTCHISNLRCKNEQCYLLIVARSVFRTEVVYILSSIMKELKQEDFSARECVMALRRELKRTNNIQCDLFDQTANSIWGS